VLLSFLCGFLKVCAQLCNRITALTRPFKQANTYKSLDLYEIGLQWLWISLKLILTQNSIGGGGQLLLTTRVPTITLAMHGPITAVCNNNVLLHRLSNLA
jgi:hypothetical protein